MKTVIKITLAVLFCICLLKMPYGFYQLVRFSAMVGFIILSYYSFYEKHVPEGIIYLGLAILFQPLIKIALGRPLWNFVDVIVGVGLIGSIFMNATSNKSDMERR